VVAASRTHPTPHQRLARHRHTHVADLLCFLHIRSRQLCLHTHTSLVPLWAPAGAVTRFETAKAHSIAAQRCGRPVTVIIKCQHTGNACCSKADAACCTVCNELAQSLLSSHAPANMLNSADAAASIHQQRRSSRILRCCLVPQVQLSC
jgi:hypothetical protein